MKQVDGGGARIILDNGYDFNQEIHFQNAYVRLPASASGYLDVGLITSHYNDRHGPNLFEFEPVKGDDGELVSPFTILEKEYTPDVLRYFKAIK